MAAELKHSIQEVLNIWNENVKRNGIDTVYRIDVKSRKKKYYINRVDFYTLDISELLFICTERIEIKSETPTDKPEFKEESLLMWRKELQIPPKVKGVAKHQIYANYEDQLYKYFLHECIGIFGLTCTESIKAKDYAPYDIEKDRLVANPYYKDHIIECTEDGAFYKKGDTFDVFQELENGWAVYTAHELGIPNNGVAKIDRAKCKVIQETEQKIELIEVKKPSIILPPDFER